MKAHRLGPDGPGLFVVALLLSSLGMLAIASAASVKPTGAAPFVLKQSLAVTIGVCVCVLMQWIPLRRLRRLTGMLILGSLALLSLILVPGVFAKVGGAYRWILVGGVSIQPSELAKVGVIALVTHLLASRSRHVHAWPRVCVRIAIGLTPFLLLLMRQPDFGTVALLAGLTLVLVYMAGAPLRLVRAGLGAACALGGAAICAAPYRWRRLVAFLDPWADVQGGGFQIIQSYLSFRNGGFFGMGLGNSKQKMFFLPESHTDFIFAVIGEELGLAGALWVLALFLTYAFLGLRIARRQQVAERRLFVLGLVGLVVGQAIFNLAVVLGLVPTKGIALPFVSAGASSCCVSFLVTGMLWRLDRLPVPAGGVPPPAHPVG